MKKKIIDDFDECMDSQKESDDKWNSSKIERTKDLMKGKKKKNNSKNNVSKKSKTSK